jgi:hypothetical protein
MVTVVDLLPNHYWEKEFFSKLAQRVAASSLPDDVSIIVTKDSKRIPRVTSRQIVLLTSDETHGVPDYAEDTLLVFRQ